jgi:hypothetical protein
MIEILQNLGLPAIVIIALLVIGTVLQQYFSYRLEKQKEKFSKELEVTQSIQSQKFQSITKLTWLISEFRHCVYHVKEGDKEEYKDRLEQLYKELRNFIRKNSLLFGGEYERVIYEFTNSGKTVLTENFDEEQYWKSLLKLKNMITKTLSTIPQVPNDLIEN